MIKILIMAGGSGERFWPLSTRENPKQLLKLVSKESMIKETVERILKIVDITDVYVATNTVQVDGVKRELPNLPVRNIIIEPAFRDTAAAIAYGSTIIARDEENPIIVVLASDHLISKNDEFIESLEIAKKEAEKGYIVTLGIKPSRPEIGYGYIQLEDVVLYKPTKAIRFLEKPNLEKAEAYLQDGNYVWNSGMFIFKYNIIMSELSKYIPNHIDIIERIKENIGNKSGLELSVSVNEYFNEFEKVSIDFAVMEHSEIIKCIPVDFGWNDIGGYNSLEEVFSKDENGNIVKDCKYFYIDSYNNIVISEEKNKLITSVGVRNLIIVNSKSGLMICNRDETQNIKKLLELIQISKRGD